MAGDLCGSGSRLLSASEGAREGREEALVIAGEDGAGIEIEVVAVQTADNRRLANPQSVRDLHEIASRAMDDAQGGR